MLALLMLFWSTCVRLDSFCYSCSSKVKIFSSYVTGLMIPGLGGGGLGRTPPRKGGAIGMGLRAEVGYPSDVLLA